MSMTQFCIHGCGRKLSANSRLAECPTCRQSLYYWRKKSAAEIISRREKLDVYSSRLDTHFNTRGRENEKPIVQQPPKKTSAKVIVLRERARA